MCGDSTKFYRHAQNEWSVTDCDPRIQESALRKCYQKGLFKFGGECKLQHVWTKNSGDSTRSSGDSKGTPNVKRV